MTRDPNPSAATTSRLSHAGVTSSLACFGVLAVAVACLWPVWRNWSGSVVAPFGGIDAMLQLGLLEWTARHWWQPSVWLDVPIFWPVTGGLGYMDSLLGQAWLVWPAHLLFSPTLAAQYNLAFLGSLLVAAVAGAVLWLAGGGPRWAAPVVALTLVGSPYSLSQNGHLNQLPPPGTVFALAALILALRRQDQGRSAHLAWWLVAASLVLQAAWGWYGFGHAVVGLATVKVVWMIRRRGRGLLGTVRAAALPALATAALVLLLAQPQIRLQERYDSFTREEVEVRLGSADIKHVLNRGVYRAGPSDWLGHGKSGLERYEGRDRQVLNPGWVALVLAGFGWWRRRGLSDDTRAVGHALLVSGAVGVVLAFGESVGLPLTDARAPLPLAWLREIIPPFKAFRGAWRFSYLMVIAVAWWSAVGVRGLVDLTVAATGRIGARRGLVLLPAAAVLLLTFVSLPAAVPSLPVPLDGHLRTGTVAATGPILTLPAPENEYAEDVTEALWLARALRRVDRSPVARRAGCRRRSSLSARDCNTANRGGPWRLTSSLICRSRESNSSSWSCDRGTRSASDSGGKPSMKRAPSVSIPGRRPVTRPIGCPESLLDSPGGQLCLVGLRLTTVSTGCRTFGDDITRAGFGLVIDSSEVLADNTQAEQDEATREHLQQDDGREAGLGISQ